MKVNSANLKEFALAISIFELVREAYFKHPGQASGLLSGFSGGDGKGTSDLWIIRRTPKMSCEHYEFQFISYVSHHWLSVIQWDAYLKGMHKTLWCQKPHDFLVHSRAFWATIKISIHFSRLMPEDLLWGPHEIPLRCIIWRISHGFNAFFFEVQDTFAVSFSSPVTWLLASNGDDIQEWQPTETGTHFTIMLSGRRGFGDPQWWLARSTIHAIHQVWSLLPFTWSRRSSQIGWLHLRNWGSNSKKKRDHPAFAKYASTCQ